MIQGPRPDGIRVATVDFLCTVQGPALSVYLSNELEFCWFLVDQAFVNCSVLHMPSHL